ncbi:MAG: PHP domain-containing protein, partial [Acidimicrobiaceae bacterium]|nr:PHP domain-containing protein [Acidimicrobiaceae bacterium]
MGGDSSVRSHKVPYAELHCHSNFSFLDGASHPEELVAEAVQLGLDALAITDHDGLYGVVRFAEAAREVGLPTIFGAELSLGLTRRQSGVADPEGTHLVVLARDPEGYTRLCRALSVAQLAGREKGRPSIDLPTLGAIGAGMVPDIAAVARDGSAHLDEPVQRGAPAPRHEPVYHRHGGGAGRTADHWVVLTGCRKGTVPRALVDAGPTQARAELARLQDLFGRDNVLVELWDHSEPLDSVRNDALVSLAVDAGAELVATNNVHYHVPARHRLAGALAAVRARSSLDAMVGWLPPASAAHLRSGKEMASRFGRYPGVVERAAEIGRACAFDLNLVAPSLPPYPTPGGVSEMAFLRRLVNERAVRRYGTRDAPIRPGAWERIDHELEVIEDLGFPGYFLIVWDIVEFCHREDILCQGRGSAANSAVCYVLGITKADAVELGLLFERFLSTARKDEAPDIDVDIESGRREEVIQYVYDRYGRGCASLVANVITYRPRSAVRDMGKALGASTGQLDAWAKQIEAWSPLTPEGSLPAAGRKKSGPWSHDGNAIPTAASQPDRRGAAGRGGGAEHDIPAPVTDLAAQVLHFPRHLGIHPGGMVLCDRPVSEVCPVEWATMADRSILQWDKEDCAAAGLVKFDLLGLGMLSAIHATIDHIDRFYGVRVDLATLPQEREVYEMLSRADSIGVFQVESRAQMATLPRLAPKEFYDLVIEVALIRPGPIQGGSVHPYLR